ncbi:MAG TPA: ArgE/DapE family deacylase [Anaerolineales bacterium]|nr:ArgE/DapE family deacylase [Anaerolineales bacterium]
MIDPEPLLSQLIAINSVNPSLVLGGAGEAEIAAFIARWLEDAGLEVTLHDTAPNRSNVVGIVRGSGSGKTLLLNGHMDTVGLASMPNPLQPQVRDGRLYGRGAYDMKGGLAACMLAAAAVRQMHLRGDLILQAVVDEEYAGAGTTTLAPLYRADGAIIAEPTDQQLVVAHKGYAWLEVETIGVAAHGSRPDLGVDAIVKMAPVLAGIEALQQRLQAQPAHPLLGHASLHASLIQGGHELATYPERCVLTVERRTLPGETPAGVEAEMQAILRQQGQADPAFKAEMRMGMSRPPLETPQDAAVVQVVQRAAAGVFGRPPELAGVSYWTDAATLWAAGIPSLLLGPCGGGAHAAEEWVDLESVAACTEIYIETARQFCA